jgi:prepilin-type N-terminal cleavage/methylation domain-containing protein
MLKKSSNGQKGFTIIEVLIVLAIAGLILLIVFLAVPALQRNSRNTQRKNDVATYAGAVNEFINNNNGVLPTTTAHVTTINNLAKVGVLTVPTAAPSTGNQNGTVAVDTLQLVVKAKCDPTNIGNSVVGPNRAFVVRFSVEDSGGNAVPQCQEG